MPTALVNDTQFYYELHGRGKPLVLVAGLASDSQSWQPILGDLARSHRVLVFDNRGVSRTPSDDAAITVERMADDCMALAEQIGFSSFDLLGHSMGGYIALDCALRYPRRVGKLILAATSAVSSGRNIALFNDWADCLDAGSDLALWFRNIFYWVLSPRFFRNEKALADAVQFELDYPYPIRPETFRRQVKAISSFDRSGAVRNIAAHTLVLAGKEDILIPPEESVELSQQISGAAFQQIERAGHSIFMENPGDFAGSVLAFLSEGE